MPSAIAAFAFAVSTIPLLTFAGDARAETCITAPNAAAPQGSHWYYRIERPSQRKCWHLAQKDQKVKTTATSPQPDLDEADEPAATPAANAPAASASSVPPQAAPAPAPAPAVKTLVTRNVSNTDDAAQGAPQPDPTAGTTPRVEIPSAPAAPAQTVRTAPAVAQQPATQAAAPPDQAAAVSPGGGPTFGMLLTGLAILGLLAAAAFLVMTVMRRRADVLNRLAEADTLPLEAAPELSPELSPAADARTFAPLPPISLAPRTDDVDEALQRFARNFRRSAA